MKALKEKRLSLRSYLRRGLVILSLFALAFAVASCGDSSSSPTDPTNPTDPSQPTTPPAVTALSIGIAADPSEPSFQGMPPDLTGVVIEVFWSNGGHDFIEAKDFATKGFYSVPGYCDIPSTDTVSPLVDTSNGEVDGFVIAYAGGGSNTSGTFKVPAVIPLTTLHMNLKKQLDWYSDQGADFTQMELQGLWKWNSDGTIGWENLSKYSGTTDSSKSGVIPMSPGYPVLDLTKVATDKTVTVKIGETTTDTASRFDTDFSLANYYVIMDVQLDTSNIPADFFAYDDDAQYLTIGAPDSPPTTTARADMFALLAKSKPNFKILYNDGKTRTITWSEFYANVRNAVLRETGAAVTTDDFFYGGDKSDTEPEALNTAHAAYTKLFVDEDNATWTFTMKYVPKSYGGNTWTGWFSVPLPVYTWENQLSVAPKNGTSRVQFFWDPSSNGQFEFSVDAGGTDYIDAINDKWTLSGRYSRKGDYKTKPIKITAGMFDYAAASGQTKANVSGTFPGGISDQVSLLTTASQTAFDRNWPLSLLYRGEKLTEDETVLIDLTYKKP